MYNINTNLAYSEDRRGLYLAVGFASLSLISYSETNSPITDTIEPEVTIQIDQTSEEQTSSELTRHAMNLAQASLEEDWNDESDEHWGSFL
ncbi:hypothetical protein FHG64_14745 [Antarcticibacterium flavum]|uniref:Uncharacterized protein n=1 Tax=Antarcticibacterium flavum TaxID=2058175 RepID=A0A5B7X540_9FLAO|nr:MULTISPECIES: hypothetical protein [Antarcticibacterium]MCM4161423.1 hypothetical protein [Antarcticibacterium sp. W02-3]QCY70556.1 hypothetical protein FHG64_14745 [Antarcticibacterium flavum]